ncbi:MAG: hypothetical protein ACLT29_04390 [Ruminococcus callidus]
MLERISNPGTLEQAQPADLSRQISQYYEKIVQSRNSGDLTELSSTAAVCGILQHISNRNQQGEVSFAQEISDLTAQIRRCKANRDPGRHGKI